MLKYSAGTMCRLGINIYKNNGAPGLPPAPGTGSWLRSFSLAKVTSHNPGWPWGPSPTILPLHPGVHWGSHAGELSHFPRYLGRGLWWGQESPVCPQCRCPPATWVRRHGAFFQLGGEDEASIPPSAPGPPRVPM